MNDTVIVWECGCCHQIIRKFEVGEPAVIAHNTFRKTWDDRVTVYNHGLDVEVHTCSQPLPLMRIARWWEKINGRSPVEHMAIVGPEND